MTTLRLPRPEELEPEDRRPLERVAQRLGAAQDKLSYVSVNTIAHAMMLSPPRRRN
jgi:hypothetical protein